MRSLLVAAFIPVLYLLIDAHGHVMGLGFNEIDVDLAGAPSLDETLERISSYASEYPELKWIRGRGWNHMRWSINRLPTADELDQVIEDRPVWLERVDGHAGWANNKAMELAGITAETKSQEGGKIIRHDDGSPTGVFVGAAMTLIESKLPERTADERQMALNEALQQMHSHGLTSVHDAGIETATGDLYKQFADQGNLTTRIYGMISSAGETFEDLSENGPISF